MNRCWEHDKALHGKKLEELGLEKARLHKTLMVMPLEKFFESGAAQEFLKDKPFLAKAAGEMIQEKGKENA